MTLPARPEQRETIYKLLSVSPQRIITLPWAPRSDSPSLLFTLTRCVTSSGERALTFFTISGDSWLASLMTPAWESTSTLDMGAPLGLGIRLNGKGGAAGRQATWDFAATSVFTGSARQRPPSSRMSLRFTREATAAWTASGPPSASRRD